jgi:asparagine synthase (glutamine-hydrolysing)
MCGFVGFFSQENNIEHDKYLLEKSLSLIEHRGPDFQKTLIKDSFFLGHARLKILDLSDLANQPFVYKHLVLMFNGEIYNYKDLKNKLIEKGYSFTTNGDTEVVIKSFYEWGNKCFEMFDGMFAISMVNTLENKIILARDIFGKKPLYYSSSKIKFVFSSELSSFPIINKEKKLNIEALNHFLALGYVMNPLTVYEEVYLVPPSTIIEFEIDSKKISKTKFYEYEKCFENKLKIGEDKIVEQVKFLFKGAVKKRLIGDVENGLFLSSGLDSIGIAYQLSRLDKTKRINAYTISFGNSPYDEFKLAKSYTDKLNIEHQCIDLENLNIDDFFKYLQKIDYSTFDNSSYPIFKLSKFAAKNVKFVLTGDGGDEIFGGYSTYKADRYNQILHNNLLFSSLSTKLKDLNSLIPNVNDRVGNMTKMKRFLKGTDNNYKKAHYNWRLIFGRRERVKLLGEQYKEIIYDTDPYYNFAKYYDKVKYLDKTDQHLFVDASTWLTDNNLIKLDRNTMLNGLEARSPYLDKELVSFLAKCPAIFKKDKFILKKVVLSLSGNKNIIRNKVGFNSPIHKWFKINEDEFNFYTKLIYKEKYEHRI